MESLTYLENENFELVDIDSEKDSSEKENSEDDNKKEKTELQFSATFYYINMFLKKNSIFGEEHLKWVFTLETHIPPPEQV